MKVFQGVLSLLFASALVVAAQGKTVLRMKDFEKGTYVITRPGLYELGENIVFNPNGNLNLNQNTPEDYLMPQPDQIATGRKYSDKAFNLGFFAAIAIASDDVILNLNGKLIEQSELHCLMQRFFAVIELARAPFPPNAGPGDFATVGEFRAQRNITVMNGFIGRSSHHGIHGNQPTQVTLKNLYITDFEVAGIHLNHASEVLIEDVTIANSRMTVPVSARFSNAVFALRTASAEIKLDQTLKTYTNVTKAQTALRKIVYDTIMQVKNGQSVTHYVFESLTGGLPDGSLASGIIFHPKVNVGHFISAKQHSYESHDLTVRNVAIANISLAPLEISALKSRADNLTDEDREGGYTGSHIADNAGAVFDVDIVRNVTTGKYIPNPLADMQIAFAEYGRECLALLSNNSAHTCGVLPGTKLLLMRNNINTRVVEWSRGELTWDELLAIKGYFIASDHDIMHHFIKGVIGIKIDGSLNVLLDNVSVEDLENHATYKERGVFFQDEGGYLGYGVRALCISSSTNITGSVTTNNTYSKYGSDNICLDLRNTVKDILLGITQGEFKTTAAMPGTTVWAEPLFARDGCPFGKGSLAANGTTNNVTTTITRTSSGYRTTAIILSACLAAVVLLFFVYYCCCVPVPMDKSKGTNDLQYKYSSAAGPSNDQNQPLLRRGDPERGVAQT